MLKNRLKIVQKRSARSFLLARFWGANRLVQKRVLVEKWLMLCLSTEVKAAVFASLCTKWALPMR